MKRVGLPTSATEQVMKNQRPLVSHHSGPVQDHTTELQYAIDYIVHLQGFQGSPLLNKY